MRFVATPLADVVIVELEPHHDDRGFFARSYQQDSFAERGLMTGAIEANVSFNHRARTLRGMHYQAEPHPDPKLVRCTAGEMFDVAVDLRPDSPTYLEWFGTTLSAENRVALHIPAGCAHGFLTLRAGTQVLYVMGAPYSAALARGVRWDDPTFGIEWPQHPEVISTRDAGYPNYLP